MKSFLLLCAFSVAVHVSAQTYPGNLSRWTSDGRSITLGADSSFVRLTAYSSDILRIDLLPSRSSRVESSFVVVQQPANDIRLVVAETDSIVTISSGGIRVRCQKYPLRLSFSDSTGRVLLSEPRSGGMSWNQEERAMRYVLRPEDHFYGTGERGTSLDKRGEKFESYNTQVPGYGIPLATMNLNVPFLASTGGYGLYIDNTYKGEFDLGASDPRTFSYTAAGGELSVYLIAGRTIPDQLTKYTWLTGRQPLPPRWALGFIQSKNRYSSEEEARSIVRTIREKDIPCDALVLDLKWFDRMGDISWNESLWPHHAAMVSDFLAQGIKTILITEPYIVQPSLHFPKADTRGFLAKDSTGHSFLLEKWWSCGGACSAALLDITNPAAQQWWWSVHPPAFGDLVAGIWTDLGEPERHPREMMHYLGSASRIHNIYNLLWAKTIFEGFQHFRPGERVVNLTRSGFAGIQRYGVLPWSGDVARSFGGLAVQLPMLLNMGMSGIAYHNSDIGGYARMPTTPELYIRWMQYGAFCPIARAHGAGETVNGHPTEPWKFGDEAERICRDFLRLRYRLLPYIYTLAHHNTESGVPLARPLFWEDPNDATLYNESSSYMWGESFLVSPVVKEGERSKEVRFPHGTWIDFWTDSLVQGGQTLQVAAPLDRMPLFVKEGSIIPLAPVMKYSDERPLDTLTLRVYPAETGETSYTLYEDDGKTLEYQSGRYAQTTFTAGRSGEKQSRILTLSAGSSVGEYQGKPERRRYVFEVHQIPRRPAFVECDGVRIEAGTSPDFPLLHEAGYFYNETKNILSISVMSRTSVPCTIAIRLPSGVR